MWSLCSGALTTVASSALSRVPVVRSRLVPEGRPAPDHLRRTSRRPRRSAASAPLEARREARDPGERLIFVALDGHRLESDEEPMPRKEDLGPAPKGTCESALA